MLGISRSAVQNVKRKRGLYFLVNYLWLICGGTFPRISWEDLESRNPLHNLHEAGDSITGVTAEGKEKKSDSPGQAWLQWGIFLCFRNLTLLFNCPSRLPGWEKGDQKATQICKKVRFVGNRTDCSMENKIFLPQRLYNEKGKQTKTKTKPSARFEVFLRQFYLNMTVNQLIDPFLYSSCLLLYFSRNPAFSKFPSTPRAVLSTIECYVVVFLNSASILLHICREHGSWRWQSLQEVRFLPLPISHSPQGTCTQGLSWWQVQGRAVSAHWIICHEILAILLLWGVLPKLAAYFCVIKYWSYQEEFRDLTLS